MAIAPDKIVDSLRNSFPNAEIELQDTMGDNDHYNLIVTYSGFAGKSKLEQHKMVYESLDGMFGGQLHAISIKTKIPKGE